MDRIVVPKEWPSPAATCSGSATIFRCGRRRQYGLSCHRSGVASGRGGFTMFLRRDGRKRSLARSAARIQTRNLRTGRNWRRTALTSVTWWRPRRRSGDRNTRSPRPQLQGLAARDAQRTGKRLQHGAMPGKSDTSIA